MNKYAELPIIAPIYSTYHYQGDASAVINDNPSIRNWFLNNNLILIWNRSYLNCTSAPKISVSCSTWRENPYLDKKWIDALYLKGHVHAVIRNLIDAGYYVHFEGLDDYYIKGKSWYKEKHFYHDGLICGYNQEDKTYCMYAYDSKWIYQTFWTPQSCFEAGRKAILRNGGYIGICGIKPLPGKVEFCAKTALKTIAEYLDSSIEKYPLTGEGFIHGIVVQEYVAKYIGEMIDGFIPYEKMDRRIFHQIWEQKKLMLESIQCIEQALEIPAEVSRQYAPLVKEADAMRMLYASHYMQRRDSVLPVIRNKMLFINSEEEKLLNKLIKNGSVKYK